MQLTNSLIIAIAAYYLNRANQQGADGKTPAWDKHGDLNAIEAAATKSKFTFCASCGTFWFGRKMKSGKSKVWAVSQENWRTPMRVEGYFSLAEVKPRGKVAVDA